MNKRFNWKKALTALAVIYSVLFLPFYALAQGNYEDVVYLKNGSIIHGVIIEQIPGQTVKIQTKDGNVFVYKMDEIERMTREAAKNTNNKGSIAPTDIKQSGFINITELNLAVGTGSYNDDASYGLQTVNGYLFSPNFSAGIGVGVDKYKGSNTMMPVFLDFRAYFMKAAISPFFSMGIGYSLSLSNTTTSYPGQYPYYYPYVEENKGGLILNPSFGVKFYMNPRTAIHFSVGYRAQEYNYTYADGNYQYKYNQSLSFINLKFGASF